MGRRGGGGAEGEGGFKLTPSGKTTLRNHSLIWVNHKLSDEEDKRFHQDIKVMKEH